MSGTNTAALAPHGTPERWQADCDCEECRWAMQGMIGESEIAFNSASILESMLHFRVRGCELYGVPAMIEPRYSRSTVRHHIDILVGLGALSKIAPIEGQSGRSGRSGVYLLHVEKLKMRSGLRLHRESEKMQQDHGFTKITSWRMMMLKEHETRSGDPCVKCGNFPVVDGGFCAHCCCAKTYDRPGVPCPVCQDMEIPKVFFDPKMRDELDRVEKARMKFSQPRRIDIW